MTDFKPKLLLAHGGHKAHGARRTYLRNYTVNWHRHKHINVRPRTIMKYAVLCVIFRLLEFYFVLFFRLLPLL